MIMLFIKKMKVIKILMMIGQISFVEPRTDSLRSELNDFSVLSPKIANNVTENNLPRQSKKYKLSKNSRDRKTRRKIRNDTRNRKRFENRRKRNSKRRYRSRPFTRGDF